MFKNRLYIYGGLFTDNVNDVSKWAYLAKTLYAMPVP